MPDPEILRMVAALTARTSERGGLFRESGGLPLGCPLSPLLGAFYLRELDTRLESMGLFFGKTTSGEFTSRDRAGAAPRRRAPCPACARRDRAGRRS